MRSRHAAVLPETQVRHQSSTSVGPHNKGMKQTKPTLWHNGRVAFAAYAQRSPDRGRAW